MSEIPATLKAARAVGGDDFFVERLQVMCIIENKPYSERLAYMVANSLAAEIVVDEDMTVSTTGVTDNKLKSALTTQATKIGANQPTPSVADRLAVADAEIAALTARVDTLGTLETLEN